ncbi:MULTISPECIES: GlsB/YeaQ/YmgE family stress response membrane protein [Actinomycetes]|uniref:Putative membrane protein YeaQ/YmgE (Transglycosylase-associated protein family) n=1 Tax=Williamsia marianensis TaxID=85044 RepID=A0A315RZM0_WILMA|nr:MULTISPECIES: GlsB/YeaQ/YmgE family stress response membrane protein [Actinomycetes]ETD32966.1 membrane protein [Williamsia sp. D3]PVY26480.1 putative membrane protein YeaQ/YmgE (transglycosylase-associated protein family) [Williamsia marianensis]RKR93900.1 putative membrane protein YeaQ/YmgE (transglycosylase-associated protein family) [Williamsia muralis]
MSTTAAAVEILAERSTTTTSVGVIGYIIIGGLAGWIASKFMGTDKQMGILLNIVVGVLGAFLGGFLLSFAFDTASGGWFFTFLTALLGAVILLAIVKAVTKRR